MVDIFAILCLVAIGAYFIYIVYYTLDLFFLNPFNKIPALTNTEKHVIAQHLPFYKMLEGRMKLRFERRVVRFRQRKKIVFYKGVDEQDKIRLLLAATGVMLTLGMADFLILSIKRILVYPSSYYSRITKKDHYGEYNPGLKTLVFSAEQLKVGFRIPNDNLNLAVHEFSHALSFNVANKLNIRSFLFLIGMNKIKRLLKNAEFNHRWEQNKYFREYGKTNTHEFFAIAVESFVETPEDFKKKYPELFKTLQFMLNFGFYKLPRLKN
ncbi:zinc-dependent peptidase [Maribacter sp. CXY002]|uniref:zinc-dependent peptidase n=1 Tax=Maribacter luteocoastalis TaxID=3407671 RepID=UPI003B67CF45